ncbi:hypothetical protein HPB49_014369 [Dermacentor silvarum]|uniref:Uncharacterized protein n=1 Tax=Dermacentor silvarum TaxID=543639 RepID=A0ACB8C474_DERSI|nr:hypothetical protein HPB49_014369 [Dermacentor silvarum]
MHGPIDAQVTKATITLGSIFEDTCTSNAQCELSRALCNEDCYLYKPSEPVSLKSNHLTCRAAAGLGYHCGCALEFVRSLEGKTCDKLQSTAGNVSDSPARPTANATLPEPLASRTEHRSRAHRGTASKGQRTDDTASRLLPLCRGDIGSPMQRKLVVPEEDAETGLYNLGLSDSRQQVNSESFSLYASGSHRSNEATANLHLDEAA